MNFLKIKSISTEQMKKEFGAGLVVFLVALPLCLGIAMASGAPLLAGLIAGVVGGLIVSLLSGAEISVSGPAAGLVVVVSAALAQIGSFSGFLVAVVLAGVFQLIFSALRLGWLSSVIPFSVIRGMIAGIGVTIVLKQIPHSMGRDLDYEGDLDFFHRSLVENTFTDIVAAAQNIEFGALTITTVSVVLWKLFGKVRTGIPRPLIMVLSGVALNQLFLYIKPDWFLTLEAGHLLNIPLYVEWNFPDWSYLLNPIVWSSALIIAAIASLETLLTLEAVDQLDPANRLSDGNRELRAQGVGNIVSGFLGGLPIAAVVLRTAASLYAGASSRSASFVHGLLILVSVLILPRFLQQIPLASVAVVLIMIGANLLRLSRPKKEVFLRKDQLFPFFVTAIGILFSNLLIGVLLGTLVGLYFMLKTNQHAAMTFVSQDNHYLLRFNKDMLFINTSDLKDVFQKIPDNSIFTIDATKALVVDQDVRDVIETFSKSCGTRKIELRLKSL